MKSRQKFFDLTVFKKDITRFAPLWVIYTLLLVCVNLLEFLTRYNANDLAYKGLVHLAFLPQLNFIYALLAAAMLLGDLHDPRLCSALHALPMRRECWLITHVAAGFTFALIPYLISAAVMAVLMKSVAVIAMLWLLASLAEFTFFFGAAVLCAMLTGNRLAQFLAYAVGNFFAILLWAVADLLYTPMLYGLRSRMDLFTRACPFFQMMNNGSLMNIEAQKYCLSNEVHVIVTTGDGWRYLSVCALIGIGLLVLAGLLYRRRNLEHAGDFAAFRGVQPFFLTCYTLGLALFLQAFSNLFDYGNTQRQWLFFGIGIVAGYFTGLMLIQRSMRIFNRRTFARFGVLLAVLAVSLLVTRFDVFGLTQRVPKLSDVESVTVEQYFEAEDTLSDNPYTPKCGERFTLDERADIQQILDLHRRAAEAGRPAFVSPIEYTAKVNDSQREWQQEITITYTLTNGSTMRRCYYINSRGEDGDILRRYFSTADCVFGLEDETLDRLQSRVRKLYIRNYETEDDFTFRTIPKELLDALAADCRAGNMAQSFVLHFDDRAPSGVSYLYFELERDQWPYSEYLRIVVYENCENTIRWLKENGFPVSDNNHYLPVPKF